MKMIHLVPVGLLMVCTLGLWGCTQQQTGTITAKVKDLEKRYGKLEEDYRVLQGANEQNKKRLAQAESQRAALEEQKNDLTKQLESTTEQRDEFNKQVTQRTAERDDLRKQVTQRTTERDSAQNSLAAFNKELQALAGRVEVALHGTANNPNLIVLPASRRND